LDQRLGELRGVGIACRVRVRFELVLAREPARERVQEKWEFPDGPEERRTRCREARRRYPEPGVEPGLVEQLPEEPQAGEAERGAEREALEDVMQLVMAELVREPRLPLRRIEPVDEGVVQHDPLRRAEAREE